MAQHPEHSAARGCIYGFSTDLRFDLEYIMFNFSVLQLASERYVWCVQPVGRQSLKFRTKGKRGGDFYKRAVGMNVSLMQGAVNKKSWYTWLLRKVGGFF